MNANPLTTVMYHYVRPIVGSAYPGVNGLEVEDFRGQLDFVQKYYTPISAADLVAAQRGETELPKRPILLSFDDGFKDHIEHVAPALIERGVSGAFYPPSCAVLERRMLDVHKIHHILAVVSDKDALIAELEGRMIGRDGVRPLQDYRAECWKASRWDPAEVRYFKRLLQSALQQPLRSELCSILFRKYVSTDEADFADSFYLSLEDLQRLVDAGMHVGSHGHEHSHLEHTSVQQQAADLDRSLQMLARVDSGNSWFSFCFPHGSYNADTLSLLKERGCAFALTARVGLAKVGSTEVLQLARIDTNDLPRHGDAEPGPWTSKLLQ